MTRSKIKLVYVHRSQFPNFFYNEKKKRLRKKLYAYINEKGVNVGAFYFFWKRFSTITRKLINKRFALYNGYIFHILRTTDNHLGYKLGEFTVTKRSVIHKGKQRQKKKKKKIKKK
jgi:ribosomal protein S19